MVHPTPFKHPFLFLVNITSEEIYEKHKKEQKKLKTIETKKPC